VNRISSALLVAAATGVAAAGGAFALSHGGSPVAGPAPVTYSVAVKQICAGAVLFEGTHSIGARAGAVSVAQDIRTSGGNRLNRVDAVPKPPGRRRLAARWIALERRLTEVYATDYLRIWNAIERAGTPDARAKLPAVLHSLVEAPQALERRAAALGAALHFPDCTGGSTGRAPDRSGGTALPPA
jgi:hypothetical protein